MCDYPGQIFLDCVATKEDLQKDYTKMFRKPLFDVRKPFAGDSEAGYMFWKPLLRIIK